jgi:ribosome-associated protein
MTDQMLLSEVFLIATANNERQVEAIADEVYEKLGAIGEKPIRREGKGQWVLLDYSDLVVHIQSEELRSYYMLDRLWNDCPRIPLEIVEAR